MRNTALPTNFSEIISRFNCWPVIQLLGALQLHPENFGRNMILERMVLHALPNRKINDTRPYISWDVLKKVIEEAGEGLPSIEPPALFTGNIVFMEGNHTVYPGTGKDDVNILNDFIEAIFLNKNQLPEEFKKNVGDALGLLLGLSDLIAKQLGHERHINVNPQNTFNTIPDRVEAMRFIDAITFEKDEIEEICKVYNYKPDIINEFVISTGYIDGEDCDELVLTKPIMVEGQDIVFYSPTTVVNSLIQYILRESQKQNCQEQLMEKLLREQFNLARLALHKMNWAETDIKLREDDQRLGLKESVFQFDNQKLGYLCFVPRKASKDVLMKRVSETVSQLNRINPKQPMQVLTLLVFANYGQQLRFPLERPTEGNHLLTLTVHDLFAIGENEDGSSLTLWKFAKAYMIATSRFKLIQVDGILNTYAYYLSHQGSLLDGSEQYVKGGFFFPPSFFAMRFLREQQLYRDEHAVKMIVDGKVGFVKALRHRNFAPIYILKEPHSDFCVVVEGFRMPIWIKNFQGKKIWQSHWGTFVCEALAFWLFRMKSHLTLILDELKFVQFEFEIVIDEKLLNAENFQVLDHLPDVEIKIEIDAPRIRVHIPFDFIYHVWQADNRADRLLVRTALLGLTQYLREAGKLIKLSIEQIEKMIDDTMAPRNAKMLLFADASYDVRLDNRGLPPLRYIDNGDLSAVLDELVDYLPNGYHIPPDIKTEEDKTKILDDIVAALLKAIDEKIEAFDGPLLLTWLIRANEKCVHAREFQEIQIPAKIACFSDVAAEAEKLQNDEKDLPATGHSLRTLIEFVAVKMPRGKKWPNSDDIEVLMALVHHLTNFGALREAIKPFKLTNPGMGLLPSGRLGIDKSFERDVLVPFSQAKVESTVLKHIENFESKYVEAHRRQKVEAKENEELDEAFMDEYGVSLSRVGQTAGALVNYGFERGEPVVKLSEDEITSLVKQTCKELKTDDIEMLLLFLTLPPRSEIGKPPKGYTNQDIFPWRFNRLTSFLRRPLIKLIEEGIPVYYFGYRHLVMYMDHLYYLIYTAKLPERKSKKMKSFLGAISGQKGNPFRKEAFDWFRSNTMFEVIEYEIPVKKLSGNDADGEYGDIDLLAIDHQRKIIYPIECKNKTGARNIHEMKVELDDFFGRDGKLDDAKIFKHQRRHEWLIANPEKLKVYIKEPSIYEIKSLILTAEDVSSAYIAKEKLPMPIISFPKLKLHGLKELGVGNQ